MLGVLEDQIFVVEQALHEMVQVVHFAECDKKHPHEVEKVDLLSRCSLNTPALREVFDDLCDLVIVDVVVRDRVSYFGVDNRTVDFVPAVIEVLELARSFFRKIFRASSACHR